MEIKDWTTDYEFADKNLIISSKTKQYMSFQFISKNENKNRDEKTLTPEPTILNDILTKDPWH